LGVFVLKASQKLLALMQVIAAPVSHNQLKVFSPVVTFILGHILLPPWKGVINLQILQLDIGVPSNSRGKN